MPFSAYSRAAGINASKLSDGRKSMLHMRQSILTPKEQTPKMRFGTAAHHAVLESGARFTICDAAGQSKDAKAERMAAQDMAGPDGIVITSEELAKFKAMREVVMAEPTCRRIIENTQHETSLFWSGNYGPAKARLDLYSRLYIADYKTTDDIGVNAFMRTAENMWYHGKMGWYMEGVEAVTGDKPDVFFIVQESKPPFDCYPVHVNAQIIAQGRKEAVELAMRWRCAVQSNCYLGVVEPGSVVEYERPAWAAGADEVNMEGVEQ
jgi:hypothetical protein